MYQLIPNQLTGLHKQKEVGNKINIQMQLTKYLSDSMNPTRVPKNSQLLYWARQGKNVPRVSVYNSRAPLFGGLC